MIGAVANAWSSYTNYSAVAPQPPSDASSSVEIGATIASGQQETTQAGLGQTQPPAPNDAAPPAPSPGLQLPLFAPPEIAAAYGEDPEHPNEEERAQPDLTKASRNASEPDATEEELPEETQREIQALKARDTEVRQHEQAHMAAAGQYARGGASFEYQVGPDGKRYAVGGEVSIDVSRGRTPEETILKAQAIRRAALAPAQPSSQDRSVAASASAMEQSARKELAQGRMEETQETSEEHANSTEEIGEPTEIAPPPNKPSIAPVDTDNKPSVNRQTEGMARSMADPASNSASDNRDEPTRLLERIRERNRHPINPLTSGAEEAYRANIPDTRSGSSTSSYPGGVASLSIAI